MNRDNARLRELFGELLRAPPDDPLRVMASLAAVEHQQRRDGGYKARVVKIHDGDTVTISDRGTLRCLRVHGVDAPENDQPGADPAAEFLSQLVGGQLVSVAPIDLDIYGRTVATISLTCGRVVNHELVLAGHAWFYEYFAPGNRVLAVLEALAQGARAGLWSADEPVAPWDWRRRERQAAPVD